MLKLKLKLCFDRRSVGQSVLVSSTHLGLTTRILLLADSCGFVDMGFSLWRENGSDVYNCCWSSPAQSSWVRVPWDSWSYFTVSDSRLHQPRGPGPRIYIPPEQGGPVIPPGSGFSFRRLLWLAGLRWRYSNPRPSRMTSLASIVFKITPRHGPHGKHFLLFSRVRVYWPVT
jgi:hypothetical protein